MRIRVGLVLSALVCQSCSFLGNSNGSRAPDTEPLCATSNEAPKLVHQGNLYRDDGLNSLRESGLETGGIAGRFHHAVECYSRALLIAPDNYDAKLGLGVTYLGLAQTEKEQSSRRGALLAAAKRNLGEAYVLRWGFHEPLYYLGEAAILERRYDIARQFLTPLMAAGYKRGPVNAAMGYLTQQEQGFRAAKPYYEAALLAGWPANTVVYAQDQLESKK
jgi:tetratricopeptide (TPR) repeat protein